MKYLPSFFLLFLSFASYAQTITIHDQNRDRHIPLTIHFPTKAEHCTRTQKCDVVLISAGYRVPYTKYLFISQALNNAGYMTIAVDHELPHDPPLSRKGDLYQTRIENWKRGAETLSYLQKTLPDRFPSYNFDQLTFIGHSNGGDISTWLSLQDNNYVHQLITFDHKRVALPKTHQTRVLSIRAQEYPTKNGILPTASEQVEFESCVVDIPHSKHMDFTDYGTKDVMEKTDKIVLGFLKGLSCADLKRKS
ncbi:hypothetical protein [Photobacterium galatheae]|uniref:Alpha/beta hydrolase n=1 Tax=Photobacterium galatheae TaxID=1654360 RepID=A0A066RRJ6_9GAMM|nr:hypothetical protein [Photobacterium galatheae]KDM91711.1 hypothetical protein EA58_10095 [Photobacterium galatheae]MCM0149822.1 alpha/beta hydrolase [Photobacterium galatheae]